MSSSIYVFTTVTFLGTILLIFAMKYLAASRLARAQVAGEQAYRSLAEKAVAIEAGNGSSLSSIKVDLSEITLRIAAIERILKEVG